MCYDPVLSAQLRVQGFEGASGGNGYLNALQVTAVDPPPPPPSGPKVYMHYMPWFNTPETLGPGNWGLHWENTRGNLTNPEIVDATGKRQIASNYYPKIGPYDSNDPDVIEYHLLLMKMAGIDGVLIDWYGVQGANGDVGSLLTNSNAIVDLVDDYDMEFGVVLEDRFSTNGINGTPNIGMAEANVAYLRDNYFNNPNYIREGDNNAPILPVFGPITFDQESQWTQILAQAGQDVEFLPLWFQSGDGGANSDGEYSWVFEDETKDDHLTRLAAFLEGRAPTLDTVGASAYPGFDVFGGAEFNIPHNNGQTLADTLGVAELFEDNYDFLQLVTWNDFGEGTIIEPTVEAGFSYLMQIQQFTEVGFGEEELEMVYRLYLARKKYSGDNAIQAQLDQVASAITTLNVTSAAAMLDAAAPLGDYDADGDVDQGDYGIWLLEFGSETILAGSGADGNFDGVIDAADYTVWRDAFIAATNSRSVPEPATLSLMGIAAAIALGDWRPILR